MKQVFNYNISNKIGTNLPVAQIEPGMQLEYNGQTFTVLQQFGPNEFDTTKGMITIPAERKVALIGIVRLKTGCQLSVRELRKGMIVHDGNVKRYVTGVTAGKVALTGVPPIYRTNESGKHYIFEGWYECELKKVKKGATFFFDGHLYVKGDYKKSLKSYQCTIKHIDNNAEIYILEDTMVTI